MFLELFKNTNQPKEKREGNILFLDYLANDKNRYDH